ncbi:odorant receptor Or2-like [Ostrinia nubilalis]
MMWNIRFLKEKRFTILNVFNFLEDPRYPLVGPHLRLLGLTGLWHPNLNSKTRFKQYLFFITIAFFFSQYVKCAVKLEPSSLMLILQYAPFHLGIIKSCFFQKDHKKWESLIDYISGVERKEIANGNKDSNDIISEYISRSRKVTYFFWALAFFSNFTIFTEPYQKNQINVNGTSVYLKIFDGYTPFSEVPPGYYASMLTQTVLGHIVSAYVVGWDTLVCTIMIFFAGQLKISRLNCANVIDINNAERSHENIVNCHSFHTILVKNQKLFNSLISPAMFVYLIVISVNLGVCIIGIVQLQDDLTTLISSCVFVMACLIQLLLFYWHSNEVTEESTLVSYGSFECDWVELDQRFKKEVALLGMATRTRLVFKAGPFNEMSLTTFIAILRLSCSFYTLLSKTM